MKTVYWKLVEFYWWFITIFIPDEEGNTTFVRKFYTGRKKEKGVLVYYFWCAHRRYFPTIENTPFRDIWWKRRGGWIWIYEMHISWFHLYLIIPTISLKSWDEWERGLTEKERNKRRSFVTGWNERNGTKFRFLRKVDDNGNIVFEKEFKNEEEYELFSYFALEK